MKTHKKSKYNYTTSSCNMQGKEYYVFRFSIYPSIFLFWINLFNVFRDFSLNLVQMPLSYEAMMLLWKTPTQISNRIKKKTIYTLKVKVHSWMERDLGVFFISAMFMSVYTKLWVVHSPVVQFIVQTRTWSLDSRADQNKPTETLWRRWSPYGSKQTL